MVMKVKRKPVNLHQTLLGKGFTLEKVVETHSKLPRQVKTYSDQVDYGEIDTFAVIPGRLVPQAKPKKVSTEFYNNNSFVIYARRYE
ncbi:hypothetical protein J4218_02190 [Candidatus Pacearchaeota archaeon]|nr:hypothetical protein [uncultured archaeon]AQS29164.1 hypothetical protein [uncultured archaeon]MBS3078908.1 hypothetical protein [Candidatus Pacearchaeota archaeon]